MSLNKGKGQLLKQRKGGFNPMNVGYSADPLVITKNGESIEDVQQTSPKPPKGGSGESRKKVPSSQN